MIYCYTFVHFKKFSFQTKKLQWNDDQVSLWILIRWQNLSVQLVWKNLGFQKRAFNLKANAGHIPFA